MNQDAEIRFLINQIEARLNELNLELQSRHLLGPQDPKDEEFQVLVAERKGLRERVSALRGQPSKKKERQRVSRGRPEPVVVE